MKPLFQPAEQAVKENYGRYLEALPCKFDFAIVRIGGCPRSCFEIREATYHIHALI